MSLSDWLRTFPDTYQMGAHDTNVCHGAAERIDELEQEVAGRRQMIYVASSWRNMRYPEVIARLRAEGIAHYDFRNPEEGNHGFSGSQVSRDLDLGEDGWKHPRTPHDALEMLYHPLADEGFRLDHGALLRASAGLLVMPCGRSAHLELGYLAGRGKPTVVLLDEGSEIDLMWRLASLITPSLDDAIELLKDLS